MSLWTPDGERTVSRTPSTPTPAAPPSDDVRNSPELREAMAEAGVDIDELTPEQLAEATEALVEMSRVRERMLSVPTADVIANHMMGIYELAAIHLGENPPNFGEAGLAIEVLRLIVDNLGPKFGDSESILRQALQQLQLAFVQLKEQVTAADPAPAE